MKFIIISDTHISAKPDAKPFLWWHKNLVPESAKICRLAVQDINRMKPDFVIHCGDLVNSSYDDSSVELTRDIFRELDCPFYFVPGNHDCYKKGDRARMNELFGLEGGDVLYRVIELEETLLLFLDGAYWESLEAEYKDYLDRDDMIKAYEKSGFTGSGAGLCFPEEEITWIETVLRQNRNKTVFVFVHVGFRGRGIYETSKGQDGKPLSEPPLKMDSGYKTSEKVFKILQEAGNVKAIFSGHLHWNECYIQNGILHCWTDGLIQYPCEMRLIKLSQNSLSGKMVQLSDPSFAKRSFVEDSDAAFIAGRPEDREFRLTW